MRMMGQIWTWAAVVAAVASAPVSGALARVDADCSSAARGACLHVEESDSGSLLFRASNGQESWSFEVKERSGESVVSRHAEAGALALDSSARLAPWAEVRVSLELMEAAAADVALALNSLFGDVAGKFVATDLDRRVDLVAVDARLSDVIAGLEALGIVRLRLE